MAATKYQVMYRYMNEAVNSPITNSTIEEYQETCEFYTDDHRIYTGTDYEKSVDETEKQEIVLYGTNPSNPKTDMIFVYNGTKKVYRPVWHPDEEGWVIHDTSKIDPSRVTRNGDYTGDYVIIDDVMVAKKRLNPIQEQWMERYYENDKLDGSVVLGAKGVMDDIDLTISSSGKNAICATMTLEGASNGQFYTENEVYDIVQAATYAEVDRTYPVESLLAIDYLVPFGISSSDKDQYVLYNFNLSVNAKVNWSPRYIYQYSSYEKGFTKNAMTKGGYGNNYLKHSIYGGKAIIVREDCLKRKIIPGHYEDATSEDIAPYVVKDTYARAKTSPWFVNSTYGSLEAALDKAKMLVDAIGIDNVKVIKVVPIDQFVKIV